MNKFLYITNSRIMANIKSDEFIDFLTSVDIDYYNLPKLTRSEENEKYNRSVRIEEMTAPVMQYKRGRMQTILIAVKGISPIKITIFRDEPSIDLITGVIEIYDRLRVACVNPKLFLSTTCNPSMIKQAYEFVHDTTNHVGNHVDICLNCEWINDNVLKTTLARIINSKDNLFKVEL